MRDKKKIEQLLHKYFEGKTSLKEEASLRQYFAREHIAPELECHRPLFNFFADEHRHAKQPIRSMAFGRKPLLRISVAAVACLGAFMLVTSLLDRQPSAGQSLSQVYINGEPHSDIRLIRGEVFRTFNELQSGSKETLATQINMLNDFF